MTPIENHRQSTGGVQGRRPRSLEWRHHRGGELRAPKVPNRSHPPLMCTPKPTQVSPNFNQQHGGVSASAAQGAQPYSLVQRPASAVRVLLQPLPCINCDTLTHAYALTSMPSLSTGSWAQAFVIISQLTSSMPLMRGGRKPCDAERA